MVEKRILIIEDDEVTRIMLESLATSLGYTVTVAANGKMGLDAFKIDLHPVVITDLEMPVMDGNTLISHVRSLSEDTVIIVETAEHDLATVIEVMKKGVFDYVLKPINKNDLQIKLQRAYETAQLKRHTSILEKEKIINLQTKLDWQNWSDSLIKRDYDRIDKALFKSLHTNFNQGAGFGTLLTLIRLISQSTIEKNGEYQIDAQIFNTIKQSANLAERALNVFSEIHQIMGAEFKFKRMPIADIHTLVQEIVGELVDLEKIKNQRILISEKKQIFSGLHIDMNNDFFKKALKELIINALKFSKNNTEIFVLMTNTDTELHISIINVARKTDRGLMGIPQEYENLIFEPFFRMDSTVYEDYGTVDFGLGLTLVEKVVEKLKGTINVSNIKDLSDIAKEPVVKVNFTIALPLA